MGVASSATVVDSTGTKIAFNTLTAGGGAPAIVAVHGTGFCKEVFGPIAEDLAALAPSFEMIAVDQRGHGDSGGFVPPLDWWDLARDVLAVLDGTTGVVGVGHSSGGAVLAMAEILVPGTFADLVLIEPIIIRGPRRRSDDLPLARAVLKRKRTFASPAAARENWRDKDPFMQWDARVLDAFVRGGLRQAGDSWELKCAPESESEFYRASTMHGAYDRLHEVGSTVHVIAGEHSNTHRPSVVEAMRSRFPQATAEVVPGATHFLPMELPGLIAQRIAAALDESLGSAHR